MYLQQALSMQGGNPFQDPLQVPILQILQIMKYVGVGKPSSAAEHSWMQCPVTSGKSPEALPPQTQHPQIFKSNCVFVLLGMREVTRSVEDLQEVKLKCLQ